MSTPLRPRLEGSVQSEEKYNRYTTLLYGLTFQRVSVDPNSLVIDPTLIALYSKPVFIAMPTFTAVRDRRDDPIDPTKGSYNALNLGLATSALGSQTNFGRVLFDNSTYYSFKKNWVFARRTQIGIEKPYGTNNFINPKICRPTLCRWKPRRFRCRSCSSPAAATRCAASPSIRPDLATR